MGLIYRAHEQTSSVWAGKLVFRPNKLEALVGVANRLITSSQGESSLILGFAYSPSHFKPVAVALIFFNGPAAAAEEFFAPLLALQPVINMAALMPYPQLNSIINRAFPYGGRKSYKGATFPPLCALHFSKLSLTT